MEMQDATGQGTYAATHERLLLAGLGVALTGGLLLLVAVVVGLGLAGVLPGLPGHAGLAALEKPAQ